VGRLRASLCRGPHRIYFPSVLLLAAALLAAGGCQRRTASAGKYSDSLVVAPSASAPRYRSYPDGRQQLTYTIDSEYPGESIISFLSTELQKRAWKPLNEDFLNPGLPSSHVRGWTEFEDATRKPPGPVWAWMADWENKNHDITRYSLEYQESQNTTLGLKTLHVVALYIPADLAAKMKGLAERKK
jgi:hypothetical protein